MHRYIFVYISTALTFSSLPVLAADISEMSLEELLQVEIISSASKMRQKALLVRSFPEGERKGRESDHQGYGRSVPVRDGIEYNFPL